MYIWGPQHHQLYDLCRYVFSLCSSNINWNRLSIHSVWLNNLFCIVVIDIWSDWTRLNQAAGNYIWILYGSSKCQHKERDRDGREIKVYNSLGMKFKLTLSVKYPWTILQIENFLIFFGKMLGMSTHVICLCNLYFRHRNVNLNLEHAKFHIYGYEFV